MGQEPETKDYRFRSTPDPRILFSTLRKRWAKLGGAEPGDLFDEWVGRSVEAEPITLAARQVWVERRTVPAFEGVVRFHVHGGDLRWRSLLYLLADLAFWTGAGYQTTRGMGQVRRLDN